jgi:hypothetical protein
MRPANFVSKSLLWVAASALAGVSLGALSSGSTDSRFWKVMQLQGANEVEEYPSLKDMKRSSDIVVGAHMLDFRFSRTVQGDAPEDVVTYALAEFVVEDDVLGNAPDVISVEFLMPQNTRAEAAAAIAKQAANIPGDDFLLFVRNKSEGQGRRRLVNMSGLWTRAGDKLIAPLVESPAEDAAATRGRSEEAVGRTKYAQELAGIDSVAELAEALRN